MSTPAKEVWRGIPSQTRQEVIEEFHRVLQEVIHEHFRFDSAASPATTRPDLREAIESGPGAQESGKHASPICSAAACDGTRLA